MRFALHNRYCLLLGTTYSLCPGRRSMKSSVSGVLFYTTTIDWGLLAWRAGRKHTGDTLATCTWNENCLLLLSSLS